MRTLFYFIALVLLFGIVSCDFSLYASDYDFVMNAVYVEPKSGTKAYVSTSGYVPKNEDVADPETATIASKILFGNNTDTLYVVAKGTRVQSVLMNDKPLAVKDSNLAQVLMEAAKTNSPRLIPDSSILEFADVILSTGAGPKGTYFKGQTKTIVVDTVYYTTHNR